MIVRIAGKLVEKKEQSLVVDVNGLFYEIIVPASVLQRIDETKDEEGNVLVAESTDLTAHFAEGGRNQGFGAVRDRAGGRHDPLRSVADHLGTRQTPRPCARYTHPE